MARRAMRFSCPVTKPKPSDCWFSLGFFTATFRPDSTAGPVVLSGTTGITEDEVDEEALEELAIFVAL
jgi:hypothetical protein